MTPEEKRRESVRAQMLIVGVILRRMRGQQSLTESRILQGETRRKGEVSPPK